MKVARFRVTTTPWVNGEIIVVLKAGCATVHRATIQKESIRNLFLRGNKEEIKKVLIQMMVRSLRQKRKDDYEYLSKRLNKILEE